MWPPGTDLSARITLTDRLFDVRLHNATLYFLRHQSESVLNVAALLSRSLKEANVVVVRKLLSLVIRNLAALLQVALVANEDAGDVVGGVLLDLAHPVVNGAEGVFVRHVVGHDDAVRALVVRRGDGLEALLAGRVPLPG